VGRRADGQEDPETERAHQLTDGESTVL
jgi:hypothetical protein